MAAGRLIFPGLMPCLDANGDRVAGAKAHFYVNGAPGTLQNTYTDAALTVPATNPVVADGVGVWPAMWADTATLFTVSGTDSAGTPIPGFSWSGVSAAIDATLASANLAASSATQAATSATAAQTAQAAALAAEVQAQAYAAAISGAPFNATSATSLTVGTGLKSLTLAQIGKLFTVGQTVVIAETSAPTVQMTGVITVFDSTTGAMTVSVGSSAGAGTHTDWTISLSAPNSSGVQATRQIVTAGIAVGGGDLSADRTITVGAAVAADVRAGGDSTKAVTSAALSGAAAFITLTDAATVAWDVGTGFNARVTLGGNRTIGAPTSLVDGQVYTLHVKQDATGSRLGSWDTIWDFMRDGTPTLSTGANKEDKIVGQYNAARGKIEAGFKAAA